MIQSFLKTPEFSNFKLSLTEYVDQPPVLQFFEAIANTAPERTIRNSTHLFAIKASGSKDQVDQARNQWSDMTTTFLSIAGGQVLYHSGEGRGENDGQFAGFSGWKSIAVSHTALFFPTPFTKLTCLSRHYNKRSRTEKFRNSFAG